MALPGAKRAIARLAKSCKALPEAEHTPVGDDGRHFAFTIRGKTFAYFTDDHHGDGRLALIAKAAAGEQAALVASDPDRFFVPPYVGPRGWVGLRLDLPKPDWTEAAELLTDAYRLTAPKKLAALLDDTGARG